jgi:RNA polymerase primary sigma factor
MKDAIGQYLDQIGTVQLLDKEREIELAQRIEAGRDAQRRLDAGERGADLARAVRDGASAKDHFIRANLRLVVSLARRYPLPPAMDLGDLIQEGNIGLEHAVDKFDWRRGFKFSTYATFWIRQAIGRALDQKASLVRLPGDRSAELRAALRASGGSQEDLDAELAALHLLTTPTSIDRPIGDGDGTEFGDLLADRAEGPEQVVVERMHEESVVALLDRLEPRARRAVQLRLGLDDGRRRSLREVGDEIGVSAEAARRMVERALDQLKVEAGELGLAAA